MVVGDMSAAIDSVDHRKLLQRTRFPTICWTEHMYSGSVRVRLTKVVGAAGMIWDSYAASHRGSVSMPLLFVLSLCRCYSDCANHGDCTHLRYLSSAWLQVTSCLPPLTHGCLQITNSKHETMHLRCDHTSRDGCNVIVLT